MTEATISRTPLIGIPWANLERLAVRFFVCYFVLYTPVVLSSLGFLGLPQYWFDYILQAPIRAIGSLAGFNVPPAMLGQPSGGVFQAIQTALLLMLATIGTAFWMRKGDVEDDYRVYNWLRIGLRYLLAYGAIHFGIIALFRYQFTSLSFESLITPAGDMRPPEILWAFFGWSWIFTAFLAITELGCGALLLRRETTLLGSLILGSVLSNVVLLNFLFGVPEKSLSPHFTAMVGLLVLPDAKRLLDVHILGRPVPPADMGYSVPGREGWIGRHRRSLKIAVIALMIFSPLILIMKSRGYLLSKPIHAYAGLYEVPRFALDGQEREPIVGDSLRWRRVVLGEEGTTLHVQLANNSWVGYRATLDTAARRMILTGGVPSEWRSNVLVQVDPSARPDTLAYEKPVYGKFVITGSLGGHRIAATLERVYRRQFKFFGGKK